MDDLIDFPVSPDWRDFYAEQGMTNPSGRLPRPRVQLPVPDQSYFESPVFLRQLRVVFGGEVQTVAPSPAPPPLVRAKKKPRGLPRR